MNCPPNVLNQDHQDPNQCPIHQIDHVIIKNHDTDREAEHHKRAAAKRNRLEIIHVRHRCHRLDITKNGKFRIHNNFF